MKSISPCTTEYQHEVLGCPKVPRGQVDFGAARSGRGSGHRSGGEGPRAARPAHLHELRAGAHMLAETQQEILLRGQDLGQLWGARGSAGTAGISGAPRAHGALLAAPTQLRRASPHPAALPVPQPRPPPPPASLTSAISILPSAFLSYLCMNSFILSPSLSFRESCWQREGSGAFSLPCCQNPELFFPSHPIPSLQERGRRTCSPVGMTSNGTSDTATSVPARPGHGGPSSGSPQPQLPMRTRASVSPYPFGKPCSSP